MYPHDNGMDAAQRSYDRQEDPCGDDTAWKEEEGLRK